MGVLSNKISREALKPGDHIYSYRNGYLYSHHGVYAGEGKVIHFTRGAGQAVGTGTVLDRVIFSLSASSDNSQPPCPVCGDQSNLGGVISSCLDCFLWGGELYLFEYGVTQAFFLAKARGGTCTLAPSDPPEDVLHRASHLLQNGFGAYDIFKNNCEDFAIYCKTGLLVVRDISVGRSGQATKFVAALNAVVSSPLGFLNSSFGGLAGRSGQATSFVAAVNAVVSFPLGFLTTTFSRLGGRTGQATAFVGAVNACVSSPLGFLTTSFCGLAAVGCGMYCVSRFVGGHVVKVPVERLGNRCRLDEQAGTANDQCSSEKVTGKAVDQCGPDKAAEMEIDQCGSDKKAETTASKED